MSGGVGGSWKCVSDFPIRFDAIRPEILLYSCRNTFTMEMHLTPRLGRAWSA